MDNQQSPSSSSKANILNETPDNKIEHREPAKKKLDRNESSLEINQIENQHAVKESSINDLPPEVKYNFLLCIIDRKLIF